MDLNKDVHCTTQDAIFEVTYFVYAAINVRKFSNIFFIYYSKAFGTMNHWKLLRVLVRYSITEVVNELIADYSYIVINVWNFTMSSLLLSK